MDGSTIGETPARIPVDIRRMTEMNALAAAYAYNFGALAPFYSGNPAAFDAWADVITRVCAASGPRAAIADLLVAQQERRGAPARAIDAARRLRDPRAVAIVTGQQAGLFGGPLYTLLKALTTLKLADQVGCDHRVPVVPIFWIDAEDHDWDEVRSCTVLDQDLAPRRVALPERATGKADAPPVATIRLDASITAALDELERILPDTEFKPELLAALRGAYAVGTGMSEAFGRWLSQALGPSGLVVFDASDPAAKPLAAPVFARELSSPGRTARLAALAGSELASRGFHAQVHPQEGSLALFRLRGGRHAIRQQNGYLVAGDERRPAADLAEEALARPETFSPNVLLRPIVQDTLFPTICYVAGPSELAYLGQLRRVYEEFGVPMPLVYPRASATLIDAPAYRFLSRYKVALDSLEARDDAALNELLRQQIPAEVEQSFTAAAAAIESAMDRVARAMPLVDPTLEGAARSTIGRMTHDLQTLRGKTIQAAKRRDETLRRQFARTRALAYPNGEPQQRTIGFIWFWNQYGPALIERLEDELPLDVGHHWIVVV